MDLSQVTLTQLRYAVAVADMGSFGGAADACRVSQSGLSMQLKKLEEMLGLVLFDRKKRPLMITSEGVDVLSQMRVVLRETERLGRAALKTEVPFGPYRLGIIPTMSASLVPLFLKQFTEQFPLVELTIDELKTEEILRRLRADTLDGGLVAIPLGVDGISELSLAFEPLLAYLPVDDPMLLNGTVTRSAISARALWLMAEGHCFRNQTLSFCNGAQPVRPSNVFFESGNFETLISLVNDGMGATLLPALVAQRLPESRRRAQLRAFDAPQPVREIGFISARVALRRRISEAIVKSLKEALAAVLDSCPEDAVVLPPE